MPCLPEPVHTVPYLDARVCRSHQPSKSGLRRGQLSVVKGTALACVDAGQLAAKGARGVQVVGASSRQHAHHRQGQGPPRGQLPQRQERSRIPGACPGAGRRSRCPRDRSAGLQAGFLLSSNVAASDLIYAVSFPVSDVPGCSIVSCLMEIALSARMRVLCCTRCAGHDSHDSCRLSVLTEALQGKSRWLRKAPLELSHPDRAVFEGQQTVLLFAAGSAAKEQWFVALNAATSADGGAGSSVHALYNTFCDYVREHALVAYPEVRSPPE